MSNKKSWSAARIAWYSERRLQRVYRRDFNNALIDAMVLEHAYVRLPLCRDFLAIYGSSAP
jgi:hypothetical protein